jgi:hypothetical protein
VEPITVPAPGLFSTITCVLSRCSSFCAARRARMSVEPPGVYGTTMVIGRLG